jgi:cytoskeletal protein RodZ
MASFGESLRREREVRGVSLQEIAAATKIGTRMLQAIEEDRLDQLPQGLFVRGFVREYARFLGLDEQKILTELSFHTAPLPEALPVREDQERRVSSRLAARLANGGLIAGVVIAVAALILSPKFSTRGGTTEPQAEASSASSSAEAGQGQEVAGASFSKNRGSSLTAEAQTAPSVLPQPLQLTLTATEDCWIGLDVGGDRVENRVLKKGESFSISARQNASLAVGNAGGLLVAIDSGPARPLGNRGEVKRNIVLSPETIGALSAGSETLPAKPIG